MVKHTPDIMDNIVLTQLRAGESLRVSELAGEPYSVRRLETLGIRPGKEIRKVSSIFGGGPVVVDLEGRMIAVGRCQAVRIYGHKTTVLPPTLQKERESKERVFFRLVSLGEQVMAAWQLVGRLYHFLFYRRMVAREMELAGIRPGDRVLHVGSGSFPFTALQLAAAGCRVWALDHDPAAVSAARLVLEKRGFKHLVEIIQGEGTEFCPRDFEVVMVSLHAHPKEELLLHLLGGMSPGARLLYRNPSGPLTRLYPSVSPERIARQLGEDPRMRHSFLKVSVLIVRRS